MRSGYNFLMWPELFFVCRVPVANIMDKHRISKYTYLAAQLLGVAILGITLNMVLNSTSRKSGIFELTVRSSANLVTLLIPYSMRTML